MPLSQSAKKKTRVDTRRKKVNLVVKRKFKAAVKKAREKPSEENLSEAYSRLDTAAKKGVIHSNKSARLKSRLAKKIASTDGKKKK